MTNETLNVIRTRRSIRKYKNEQIKDEELKAVLEAGTYAPTSRGMQLPYIIAVQNEDLKKELIEMNAEILGSDINPYYDAPTIILVVTPANSNNPIQDGSCILENMMIAANSLGLGTCWIHREKEMFETQRGKDLLKKIGLPDGLMGIGALSIGYPDEKDSAVKPRKEDYYRIIK